MISIRIFISRFSFNTILKPSPLTGKQCCATEMLPACLKIKKIIHTFAKRTEELNYWFGQVTCIHSFIIHKNLLHSDIFLEYMIIINSICKQLSLLNYFESSNSKIENNLKILNWMAVKNINSISFNFFSLYYI